MMSECGHITVVGSGLIGLSAALALSQAGFQVTILSQSPLDKQTQDQRPISISLTTQRFLQNINVWTTCRFQAAPIDSVHTSEQGVFGALRLSASDINADALGYVLPFYHLEQVLIEQVMQSTIDFHQIDDVCVIEEGDEEVTLVVMEAGHTQHRVTDWLIAADGRSSKCRELLEIEVAEARHGDVAHTAIVTCESPHANQAFERFTQHGVWAMLPMWKSHQYRLVWTTQGKSEQPDDVSWLQQLKAVFLGYVTGINSLAYTGSYPLQTIIATSQACTRCVLLGDAAHRLYPISAQGFNLSVRDVAALVDTLVQGKPLVDYVKQRLPDQRCVARLTALLEQLFGTHVPGLKKYRGLALGVMDAVLPFKRHLINQLLGRQGKQPSLLCKSR